MAHERTQDSFITRLFGAEKEREVEKRDFTPQTEKDAKAARDNQREHTVATGVDVIKDDDDSTTSRTLTPSETDGVITVTPS